VDEEVVPVLYVEEAARAVAWYARLGFEKDGNRLRVATRRS
jgi:hypothetical protein